MAPKLGDILSRMRSMLDKEAEARLGDGNVLGGNRTATDGAGDSVPKELETKDTVDIHDSRKEHDVDGKPSDKATSYSVAGEGNEKKTKDTAVSSPPAQKVAALANKLMAEMNQVLGTGKSASFTAGEKSAEAVIGKLLKVAQEDEDEEKDEEESEEEPSEDVPAEIPAELLEEGEAEEEAPAEEEIDLEKLSSDQKALWGMYEKAGAQACREFLSESMQKQAAAQQNMPGQEQAELMYKAGHQLSGIVTEQQRVGYEAAVRDVAAYLNQEKQAKLNLAYQKNIINQSVKEAIDSSVKEAEVDMARQDQRRREQSLARLADALSQGGTPPPFQNKAAAYIDQVHPLLSGLLNEGVIDDSEKQNLIDYFAAAERMTSDTIDRAAAQVKNSDMVRERLTRNILQQNTHSAPSPAPAMPVTQKSPDAQASMFTGAVSQHEIPGSIEEREESDPVDERELVKTVLKQALYKLEGSK